MALIESVVSISAPREKVWDIIADLDSEPKYWKGTKSVKNISKDGEILHRQVTIAFRDKICKQRVEISKGNLIKFTFTDGIILGTKIVMIESEGNSTILKTTWDIEMSGALKIFTGMLKKHIKGGTEQALCAIKKEAECANSC